MLVFVNHRHHSTCLTCPSLPLQNRFSTPGPFVRKMCAAQRNVAQAAEDNISCLSDTDNCYEESFASWMSEPQSLVINWRGWKRNNDSGNLDPASSGTCALLNALASPVKHLDGISSSLSSKSVVLPLVELAAQAVAKHIPFEVVETVRPPVPEQLHLRIAFWSFPDNEEDIRMYACLANGSAELFVRAEELLRKRAVYDLLQIGFHLSASVSLDNTSNGGAAIVAASSSGAAAGIGGVVAGGSINVGAGSGFGARQVHEVALTFDRKKIITCNCTCAHSSWCPHIIVVCLQRILRPEEVVLRAPISESLSRLQRDQLQKFAQYLISELPKQILPTAQKLLDDLLDGHKSRINSVRGAPDPTAGASINEKTNWFLDVSVLHENIRKILLKLCIPSTSQPPDGTNPCIVPPPAASEWQTLLGPLRGKQPEGIWNLMAIVREMMKRGDSNAVSLLRIVTQEIMDCSQIINWWFTVKSNLGNSSFGVLHSSNRSTLQTSLTSAQHACASLCEEIVALWRLACLNPRLDFQERDEYFELLKTWHVKVLDTSNHNDRNDSYYDKYHGFKPALEACYVDWSNFSIPGVTIPANNKTTSTSVDESPSKKAKAVEKNHRLQVQVHQDSSPTSPAYAAVTQMFNNMSIESKPTESLKVSLEELNNEVINENGEVSVANDENVYAGGCDDQPIGGGDVASDQQAVNKGPIPAEGDQADFNNDQDKQLNALYKFSFNTNANIKYVCNSLNNEKTYTITVHKTNDMYEVEFARAEALYAHGFTRQAIKFAVRLAEHLLLNPPQMNFDLEQLIPIRPKKSKSRYNPILRQNSFHVSALYNKITFLCRALCEDPAHYDLAFQTGLLGLQLARPPAPIKSLETKLHNQEKELFAQMKQIPLESKQIATLRQKAVDLRDDRLPSRGAVLPLTLAHYIFNVLVLNTKTESLRSDPMAMIVQDRFATDEQLAFAAAVNVLGMKCIIPEVDYPLLCEGIRSQRKELAMCLLTYYKNDERRLVKIMEKLLDRSTYRKVNHCFMNCHGICICQSAYSCPNCVQAVEHVTKEYSSKKMVDTFDKRINSSFANQNKSSLYQTAVSSANNCQLSESLSASANYLYPSEDPFSVDPYKDWSHAQPAEQRANGFAFDTSNNGSMEGVSDARAGNVGVDVASAALDRSTTSRGSSSLTNESTDSVVAHNETAEEGPHLFDEQPHEDKAGEDQSLTRLDQLATCLSCACLLEQSKNLDKYSPLANFSSHCFNIAPNVAQPNLQANLLMINPWVSHHHNSNNNNSGHNAMMMNRKTNLCSVGKIRYKEQRNKVCMNSCQTTKAAAYFSCDLAQALLKEAGGTNEGHAQFQLTSGGEVQINKLLHFCAFQLGLYSLGLHNSIGSTWYIRTYSGHSSWVTNQAIEIGPSAISFLIATWRGHLTPSEVAALADRASRGYSSQMARTASRLVLSCLFHASALSQNEIHRAVLQCKEQSDETLMKALDLLEHTARQGGISFEILFEVARRWSDLADGAKARALKRKKKSADTSCGLMVASNSGGSNGNGASTMASVVNMSSSVHLSISGATGHYSKVSSTTVVGPGASSSSSSASSVSSLHASRTVAPQSLVPVGPSPMMMGMYMNHFHHQPNYRTPYPPGAFAPSMGPAQHLPASGPPPSLLPTPPTQSNVGQTASANALHPSAGRMLPNGPGHFNMPFWPWSAAGPNNVGAAQLLQSQPGHPSTPRPFSINNFPPTNAWPISHHPAAPQPTAPSHHHQVALNAQMMQQPPPMPTHATSSVHPASALAPPTGASVPIAVQSLPIHGIQMQNACFDQLTGQLLIPSNSYLHSSTVSAGIAAVLPDAQHQMSQHVLPSASPANNLAAGHHQHPHHHHNHPLPINNRTMFAPHYSQPAQGQDINQENRSLKPVDAYQSYLFKAYQVGLLAMERLCKRVHEEKPRNRYARFTPYGDDVKWLFSICKKLGLEFVQAFLNYAETGLQSPFVLHEIIDLARETLRAHYQLPEMQVYGLPMLKPLIQKCQHL